MIPAIKDANAIGLLVPLLAKDKEALGPSVHKEVLHALYNICQLNKRVHLELAATANLVPHLCRISQECLMEREGPAPTPGEPGEQGARVGMHVRWHCWPVLQQLVGTLPACCGPP